MRSTHGIPLRFQYNCAAYIGGAGLAPIAHEKIKLSIPLNKAGYTTDQLEHIQMIVNTGQAAMRLTDHVAVHRSGSIGADPDIILRCQTWEDMPEAQLPMLLHQRRAQGDALLRLSVGGSLSCAHPESKSALLGCARGRLTVRITSFYVTGGVGRRVDDVFWAVVIAKLRRRPVKRRS
jgi:hypothetical protein